jgi:hypothetical protein
MGNQMVQFFQTSQILSSTAAPGSARRLDLATGHPKVAGSGSTVAGFSGGGHLRALGPAATHGVVEAVWWVGWQPGRPPVWPRLLPLPLSPLPVAAASQHDGCAQ